MENIVSENEKAELAAKMLKPDSDKIIPLPVAF